MELRLKVEGASPEDLQRGIDAAWAVFTKHDMDPITAADGMFALEGWDDAGFPDDGDASMTEEEGHAADVWMEAGREAVKACCASWDEPQHAFTDSLEVVLSEEEKASLMDGDEEDDEPF
jgi:hypothetical protein